jgi:hypothetical protein
LFRPDPEISGTGKVMGANYLFNDW